MTSSHGVFSGCPPVDVLEKCADGAIDVVVNTPGEPEQRFTLVREADSVSAFDSNGVLLGKVGDGPDGQPALLAGALAR